MTALPEESPVDPRITDAELVGASIEGDRAAFAQIYDRYADRLYDFCAGMLRDLDGAADCVQETFYLAATRLRQLRDPDRLRPWLYAIARNEALRRLGEWHRETPAEDLPDTPSQDAGPDTLSARSELAELIAEVAGGLSDRDRAVLDLAFRHGLNGPDLADALGMTHTNANTVVARLRRTIERSLGALLVSRSTRKTPGGCTQLRDILAGWDGRFTVLVRKRVSRHIESCPTCDEQRRRLVSPAALLGAVPLIPAPESLRDRTLTDIQLTSHGSAMTGVAGDTAGSVPDRARRRHSRMLLAALMIAELGAAAALLSTWPRVPGSTVPTKVTETVPVSTGQAPEPTATETKPPPQAPPSPPPTTRSWQPPEVSPSRLPGPASPEVERPSAPAPPPPRPPSTKPPMSFSPDVTATPGAPPDSDNQRDSRRTSDSSRTAQ